uniref:Calcium channel, voltage dependent, alpha2/delta subunit 3 n=1 Tax=Salmo trutta TaxID=8032 RepID=A0A674BKP5_SALTR
MPDTLLSFSHALTAFQLPSNRAWHSLPGPPTAHPAANQSQSHSLSAKIKPINHIIKQDTFYQVKTYFLFHLQKYKELEKSVRVEEIDGMKVVKNLSKKMEEMFRKKKEAIRVHISLVEAAEEAHLQHEENPELQYEYFNAVLINNVDEEGNNVELGGEFVLEPNEHFNNLSVNLSLSVVQVPTNMYNKDPAIVNGVYWSEALNKVFVDNFEKDPSLIWQYFGSAKGFFRQYPGVKWHPDEHGVIAFDCRNRKWYIQAATSPKDVVILVDVSGSMKGLRLTIARQTVSSILDTLGDDDFFNIIAYNQEIHYVEPCLNGTLVRADRNNKAHFREHLDKLFAKGIGLLGDALTEAFTILNDFNQTGHGSVCSQAIMLVTDGATQMYDDVFAKFNWPDRKVRIFPYLIGRESAFADNMKWMACANKGYFSQISTLADVQENVMRYLHVMSRPKVIDHEHDTVWTEAYMDSTGSIIGPSLMTTVAMPVFSTKNETVRGILLGVVGTDIPLQELMKIIPKHLLGIHGYAFAITNNGYILTHPDLRPLYQKGQKRRKPNYSSVDLSEVEWEDKDDFLRNAMVNRKTGTFSMEVKKTVDKGKRLLKMHNDYYYTEVKGTPFRCVQFPIYLDTFSNWLVVFTVYDFLQCTFLGCVSTYSFDRTYCNTDEHYEHRSLSQIQAIKLYLTGRKPLIKCDRELIQEVLFDAVVTAPLEAYWTGLALNKSENSDKGVEIAYLGTRTGLSRTNLFVVPEDLSNQDFLTAEDKEGVFNADHFPLWYKRAAEQVPGTFVYSIPFGGKVTLTLNVPLLHPEIPHPLNTALPDLKTVLVPCDTEYPAFVSERTIKETTGNIDCEGCVRYWEYSYLLSVKCKSEVWFITISILNPSEHNESLKCDRLKFQKDRKRPESCHPFHPEENAMECGGAAGLSAPLTAALLPLLATLFTR